MPCAQPSRPASPPAPSLSQPSCHCSSGLQIPPSQKTQSLIINAQDLPTEQGSAGREMAMKVYGLPMSTNVARVLVCLEEAGAEYEVVQIDFSTGEHKSPEHTSRNPFGQVPALQDGDLILFESRAIAKYVLRKNKSELLKEESLPDSAKVDVWLEVESHHFDRPMAVVIYQCLILPVYFGGQTDVKIVEENLEKLKKAFEVYEGRLSSSKYLAGDFISFADLSHFPSAYYFLATPHAAVLDGFPRVKAWINDMLGRPTVKKVIEMMKATA